jgi:hypothetical protein
LGCVSPVEQCVSGTMSLSVADVRATRMPFKKGVVGNSLQVRAVGALLSMTVRLELVQRDRVRRRLGSLESSLRIGVTGTPWPWVSEVFMLWILGRPTTSPL